MPELWVNLFSVGKALKNGFQLSNKGLYISLTKNDTRITFDKVFKTGNGFVMGIVLIPKRIHEFSNLCMTSRKMPIEYVHACMTHPGENTTRLTAKYYGMKIQGTLLPCEDCALSKARQSNLNKTTDVRSKVKGERLCIDISYTGKTSLGGSIYWLLIMDDCTDYLWSYFLKEKSDTTIYVIRLIKDLNAKGFKTKYMRCDNAGENKALKTQCEDEGLGINFEFTARNTPQHNGKVERKFQTLYGRIKSQLNQANLPEGLKNYLWAEAANTATLWDNAMVKVTGDLPAYTKFWGKDPTYINNMHPFGEMGVAVKPEIKIIKGKLKN